MSSILLTGACGFIGTYTCAELRRRQVEFVGIDRIASDNCIACDLTNPDSISELFEQHGFDCVIHLAAILPTAASADPLLAARVNVDGSIGLLETAIAHRCRRFVFGSSTSVYGDAGLTAAISEEHAVSPLDVYGAGKRFVEIVGETLHKHGQVEFAALRIATVVGPGARNTSSPWRSEIFEKLRTGTPQAITLPYFEDDLLTLVNVEDLARMLVDLAQRHNLKSLFYNTPAQLWRVGDLKSAIEAEDPNVTVHLSGRNRAPAPLSDGRRFAEEFAFESTPIQQRLVGFQTDMRQDRSR